MNALPSGSRWYRDPTLFSLVSANLVTMLLALTQHWDLATVVWVYWGQSVAYGVVCCLRLLAGESSKEYAHGWLDSAARFVANAASTLFFLLHYGAFHFIYADVLMRFQGLPPSSAYEPIAFGIGAFFLHHLGSFVFHRWGKREASQAFSNPYYRILPMHFFLVFAPVFREALLGFLLIRAGVDVATHVLEHRLQRKTHA